MKKGANTTEIFSLIDLALSNKIEFASPEMENFVKSGYNQTYGCISKSTVMSNIREEAILKFQEEMYISKLPQDNNKVDFIAAKIEQDVVKITISQQKGNNASFNSTSLSKTLEKLQDVKNKDHVIYFGLLPDYLNPNKNEMNFELDVIIGFTMAQSDKVESFKSGDIEIDYYCGDMYLEKMGIKSKSMIYLDRWVYNQEKVSNHKYDAISKCVNFNDIYQRCLEVIKEHEMI